MTELEILYGVMDNGIARQATRIYCRHPLPYVDMGEMAAIFSDEFSDDPTRVLAHERLEALKDYLLHEIPERVRWYSAKWNHDHQCVRGLEAWSDQVVRDLWADLDLATSQWLIHIERTPEEEQEEALAAFVEDRRRDFVGREDLLNEISHELGQPRHHGRALLILAEDGCGKSAVFARACDLLEPKVDVLLAHSTESGAHASDVTIMLRRWCLRMAKQLGESDILMGADDLVALEDIFQSRLARCAERGPVVILLDEPDGLNSATRLDHLRWLTATRPSSVDVIITSRRGRSSAELVDRVGCHMLPLSSLTRSEVVAMVHQICRRYHRVVDRKVVECLLSKTRRDGLPAYASALWIAIAVEALNTLDSADFDRAESSHALQPPERISWLIQSTADDLPADVDALCEVVIRRCQRAYGEALTNAFLEVLALGVEGWRELDLRSLVPIRSGVLWDPAGFAAIRRGLLGYVRQAGRFDAWRFAHRLFQQHIVVQLAQRPGAIAEIHRDIAGHLMTLPVDDPMRSTTVMVHLLAADDIVGASRYLSSHLRDDAARSASFAVADAMATGRPVASLLDVAQPVPGLREVCRLFVEHVAHEISDAVPVESRLLLFEKVFTTLTSLRESPEWIPAWTFDLVRCRNILAGLLDLLGRSSAALEMRMDAIALLTTSAPTEGVEIDDQLVAIQAHRLAAESLRTAGRLTEAARHTGRASKLAEMKKEVHPHDLGVLRELAASLRLESEIADQQATGSAAVLAERAVGVWQSILSAGQDPRDISGMINALMVLGDLCMRSLEYDAALLRLRQAKDHAAALVRINPDCWSWQRQLAMTWEHLGDVLIRRIDFIGAREAFEQSAAIFSTEIVRLPANWRAMRDYIVNLGRLGTIGSSLGDDAGARKSFEEANRWNRTMVALDPTNARWTADLFISWQHLAIVCRKVGDFEAAWMCYDQCTEILDEMSERRMYIDSHWKTALGELACTLPPRF